MARSKHYELAPRRKWQKFKRIFLPLFGLLLVAAYLIIPVWGLGFYFSIRNNLLSKQGQIIKGYIIDDRNYFGNNTRKFSYSYQFVVNGKQYTGNSLDSRYKIGDVVHIRYVPQFPSFNERLETDEVKSVK
jgi:hypothetical protein